MVNFTYYTPTEIIFGNDSEMETSKLIKKYMGTKVLVHYGGESAKKSGLLETITNNLKNNNIEYLLLGNVQPNPLLSKVEEGVTLCKENNVDFILAIGGGSVIDSAKAIAVGAVIEENVADLIGTKGISKSLPVGVILTIAAAGSEMSGTSVITNDNTLLKRSFSGTAMRPVFAILNPKLTYSLPKYQTACGAADIIMHTVERYFTEADSLDLTDQISTVLIQNVMKHTNIVLENPTNYASRAEIMWSGSLSHNDLTGARSNRGDWACHQLGHELSAKFKISHGASLTAIWPTWARYVYPKHQTRFIKFALEVMKIAPKDKSDIQIIEAGIDKLEAFFKDIGLPTSLKDFKIDIRKTDIDDMSLKASRFHTFKPGNIQLLEYKDIEMIYNISND